MSLKFVICGLEHSGTTLLSDIFRQVESLDSGFEVGVLLGNSPKEFPTLQPFYENMPGGWKIEPEVLDKICQTDSFIDFYDRLKSNSQVIAPEAQDIFDKTPRYFQDIYACYEKAQVPIIGLYKDPRSLVYSDYKRSGKEQKFESWYENYKKGKLRYLKRIYENSYLKWKYNQGKQGNHVFCTSLEEICLNTKNTLEKMFIHVDYPFELKYLLLKNLRYHHTRQPQISSRIPFEYLEKLSSEQIQLIEKDFCSLEDWFYC